MRAYSGVRAAGASSPTWHSAAESLRRGDMLAYLRLVARRAGFPWYRSAASEQRSDTTARARRRSDQLHSASRCLIKMSFPWKIRQRRDNHEIDMSRLYYNISGPIKKSSPLQDRPQKSLSPANNLPAKIRPARAAAGRCGFLPVTCRPGETFLRAIL